MTDSQQPKTVTINNRVYKVEDLSQDAVLLVNTLMENQNLQGIKEAEYKHLKFAHQAVEENLKLKLEGLSFTEVPEEEGQ